METRNYLPAIKSYIDKMPSLPTTVTKIMEICNDPQASPADLNKVISLDPVLMGKVMQLINSAYYGLSQEVTSLVRAIIMLGLNTVKNLSLSTAVLGSLGQGDNSQALNMDGFWRHSLAVGATAKLIAKQRNVDRKILEEYFMAGLLHDIGKIPLTNRLSKQYLITMSVSDRDHNPLYISEKQTLGIDHGEVGNIIGKLWKLDAPILDAMTYHHSAETYTGNNKDLLYTVILANYFSNDSEIGFSGDRYPEEIDPEILNYLNLTMEFLEDEIEFRVSSEIEKAQIFLKLAT